MAKRSSMFWVVTLAALLVVTGFIITNAPKEKTDIHSSVFYVPNAGDGTISVVDYMQEKVVDTISLSSEQASHGIAISPNGEMIYAGTGFDGKKLVAIHAKSKKVINKLSFDEGVHGIDISLDGKKLYVSLNPGLGQEGGGLAIVEASTLHLIKIVETGEGPAHVAVSKDGSQIWVANVNDQSVSVIDSINQVLLATIPVGEIPNEVAISPDGRWVFSANVGSNTVSVIDTSTLQVVNEIKAGEAPHGVTVSPDGKELWVSNNRSNDVSVINVATLETVASISTGSYANHIAFTSDGQWAFVTNRQSNDVVKINAATRQVVGTVSLGAEPHEISLEDYPFGKDSDVRVTAEIEEINIEKEQSAVPIEDRTRFRMYRNVEMDIAYLIPEDLETNLRPSGVTLEDFDKNYVFRISLTTHSGDISSLIKADLFHMVVDENTKVTPAKWIKESNDSHHPSYIAFFPKTNENLDEIRIETNSDDEPVWFEWNSAARTKNEEQTQVKQAEINFAPDTYDWQKNGSDQLYIVQIKNGVIESQLKGIVRTDTDCAADAEGLSHCNNQIELENGGIIEVINTHNMMDYPCLEPNKEVMVMPLDQYWGKVIKEV